MRKLLLAALLIGVVGAADLGAATYTIFVHGRSGNHCGTSTTDVGNYWGSAKNISTSTTRYFVGYDGASDPRTWGNCRAQTNLHSVLTTRCKGSNNCRIICHSAGCYATEYYLDKTASGLNIDFVMASASAAGGSELANMAFWASNSMNASLKTSAARGSYNHNDTKGISIWSLAGFDSTWYAGWILPGSDDGAVAFHSACGHSSTGSHSRCDRSRYSNHYIWIGSYNNNNNYSSSKRAYDRTHVGSGSSSINDAMKKEWADCRNAGVNGLSCN